MNQRQATVSTILAVLEERGVSYELNGETPISEVLTDKDRALVRDTLFAMFRAGQVEMAEESKAKYSDDKDLKNYVSGLVNNWIRKAPEFNNNSKYVAKNPGSRQGSSDEMIKEMRKLLSQTQDPTKRQLIQNAIAQRQEEIKPKTEIDVSKLPAHLRDLV